MAIKNARSQHKEDLMQRCFELDRQGFSQRQVAKELGISQALVCRYVNEARQTAQSLVRRSPQWLTDWVERVFDHLEVLRNLDRESWSVLERAKLTLNDDRVLAAINTIRSNANERAKVLRLLDPRISIELNINVNEAKQIQDALFRVIASAPDDVKARAVKELRSLPTSGGSGGDVMPRMLPSQLQSRLSNILNDRPTVEEEAKLSVIEAEFVKQ